MVVGVKGSKYLIRLTVEQAEEHGPALAYILTEFGVKPIHQTKLEDRIVVQVGEDENRSAVEEKPIQYAECLAKQLGNVLGLEIVKV